MGCAGFEGGVYGGGRVGEVGGKGVGYLGRGFWGWVIRCSLYCRPSNIVIVGVFDVADVMHENPVASTKQSHVYFPVNPPLLHVLCSCASSVLTRRVSRWLRLCISSVPAQRNLNKAVFIFPIQGLCIVPCTRPCLVYSYISPTYHLVHARLHCSLVCSRITPSLHHQGFRNQPAKREDLPIDNCRTVVL